MMSILFVCLLLIQYFIHFSVGFSESPKCMSFEIKNIYTKKKHIYNFGQEIKHIFIDDHV
jgi:hypothetical protein